MATALQPCPGRRCGVENHEVGSLAYARCQAIGQKTANGSALPSTKFAASTDPDVNAFGVITADAIMVDEDKHTYFYDVELESSSTDASMTVRYGKGKALVADSGDPTAAEVIASIAREAVDYEDLMGPESLEDFGFDIEPDWDNADDDGNPGPSPAQVTYEKLRKQTEQFEKLIGDDKELVLEAVRQNEGEDYFDEVTWRQTLGLEIGERSDYDAYGSAVASDSFTIPLSPAGSSEDVDREMDQAFATAGVPSDAAALTTIQWLGVRTDDEGFQKAAGGDINRRDLQEAINRVRKGDHEDLTDRDDRDLIVLDQWVRTHE